VSRILVIDDDQDLGRVIRRVLELEGYDVVLSDDGLRGLAAAQRQRPDAIVLDLMMPVMDGYQVLAELRDDERTKDVPVVVLTAVALDETRERVEAAGAATFLTKPFEPKNLSRALASLVGSSSAD
jgi:CheY-like chemotaxis protein